jgi:hypothetical protein
MTFDLDIIKENDIHKDPEKEIKNIQGTFEACIKKNGHDSFSPMLILFDSSSLPMFVVESRPYGDKTDMYSAFAEMLYSFRAIEATSFVMTVDTKLTLMDNDQEKVDALVLTFATRESACVVVLPYRITSTHEVIWNNEDFHIAPLTSESNNYSGGLTDLYFIMSHIESSPFSFNTLVNYYSFRDFPFHTSGGLVAEKIMINI